MEIRESAVNPKLSKYMCIDKSESENIYRKRVASIGTHKHAKRHQTCDKYKYGQN